MVFFIHVVVTLTIMPAANYYIKEVTDGKHGINWYKYTFMSFVDNIEDDALQFIVGISATVLSVVQSAWLVGLVLSALDAARPGITVEGLLLFPTTFWFIIYLFMVVAAYFTTIKVGKIVYTLSEKVSSLSKALNSHVEDDTIHRPSDK